MATTNYSFNLPTVGGSEDAWGTQLNANWTALDTLLGGVSQTEFAILDGLTVTTAELNILDGVTATTAELNILDGVTATTAELNILDGVTATAAELNVVDGIAGIASQAEAEAGTATNKLMNPLRTAQAISALAPAFTIADGSITTVKLADSSVTTAKIANGNVTTAKLPVGVRSFSGSLSEGDSAQLVYADNFAFLPNGSTTGTTASLSITIRSDRIVVQNFENSTRSYTVTWRYLTT